MSAYTRARKKATNVLMATRWRDESERVANKTRWSHLRPKAEVLAELAPLMQTLLLAKGKLGVRELVGEYMLDANLPRAQAAAEVGQYHAEVAQSFRDKGVLIYPVTKAGFDGTYTSPALGVPGRWGAGSTYGWHVATGPDELWNEYTNRRFKPIIGGMTKQIAATEAAALAGVIPQALDRTILAQLPDKVS